MENIKLNPGWEALYKLNFPTKTHPATPEGLQIVTKDAGSIAISPAPVSSPEGKRGNIGKNILIVVCIGLGIYGAYCVYKYHKAKNENRF